MKENDRIRIQHMIDASEEAISFIHNVDFKKFSENRMLVLSIIKEIEIVGEAASRISEDTKLKLSDIPWKDIVSMRNRLIHGYFNVNVELVWNTVNKNLPPLVESLRKSII